MDIEISQSFHECCDRPKTRGPNVYDEMVCPVHCSKCGHDRKYEDYLDFCLLCEHGGPCASTNASSRKSSGTAK